MNKNLKIDVRPHVDAVVSYPFRFQTEIHVTTLSSNFMIVCVDVVVVVTARVVVAYRRHRCRRQITFNIVCASQIFFKPHIDHATRIRLIYRIILIINFLRIYFKFFWRFEECQAGRAADGGGISVWRHIACCCVNKCSCVCVCLCASSKLLPHAVHRKSKETHPGRSQMSHSKRTVPCVWTQRHVRLWHKPEPIPPYSYSHTTPNPPTHQSWCAMILCAPTRLHSLSLCLHLREWVNMKRVRGCIICRIIRAYRQRILADERRHLTKRMGRILL